MIHVKRTLPLARHNLCMRLKIYQLKRQQRTSTSLRQLGGWFAELVAREEYFLVNRYAVLLVFFLSN